VKKAQMKCICLIGAYCVHLGWLKILSFETSTFASKSSMGDLQLCLLFVLFVPKLSKPVIAYFFWEGASRKINRGKSSKAYYLLASYHTFMLIQKMCAIIIIFHFLL
jgi:hypothetical protein